MLTSKQLIGGILVAGMAFAACGSDDDSADGTEAPATEAADAPATDPPETEPPVTEAPATDPTVAATSEIDPPATEATEPVETEPPVTEPPVTEPSVAEPSVTEPSETEAPASDETIGDEQLEYAENLVDAFYAYDLDALTASMGDVEGADFVTFYQGWAEGAHYEVLERTPCEPMGDSVTCAITVQDDFVAAVGIDFNVTDTFHIRVDAAGEPAEIWTTSNDPEEMWAAFDWVFVNKPELFAAECIGFFEGGPTPGACAEQFVAGFSEYSELQEASEG